MWSSRQNRQKGLSRHSDAGQNAKDKIPSLATYSQTHTQKLTHTHSLMLNIIGRSGERGSGISVLPARYDDDDYTTPGNADDIC